MSSNLFYWVLPILLPLLLLGLTVYLYATRKNPQFFPRVWWKVLFLYIGVMILGAIVGLFINYGVRRILWEMKPEYEKNMLLDQENYELEQEQEQRCLSELGKPDSKRRCDNTPLEKTGNFFAYYARVHNPALAQVKARCCDGEALSWCANFHKDVNENVLTNREIYNKYQGDLENCN